MKANKNIKTPVDERSDQKMQQVEEPAADDQAVMHTASAQGTMHTGVPLIRRMASRKLTETPKGKIVNGGEIEAALNSTDYGKTLIKTLIDTGLEFVVNINGYNGGQFGAPKKIMKDDKLTGWELNFQKYNKSRLWGTRFDGASKTEFYGSIGAHDVIDTATPKGIEVNEKKVKDAANPDSDYMKKHKAWKDATEEKEAEAKADFFQFLIDNYEQVGMDAELKFRESLAKNTLDFKIGELNASNKAADLNPDLVGKTPRQIYTTGVK